MLEKRDTYKGHERCETGSHIQKGGTDLPQSYRPIALLNVIYKLLASIIQTRISSKMDGTLDENQYGCRKGKSTAQPLFTLRRTQETQEEAALEGHLLLLDWEKAFDKVPQDRMIKAIGRLGIPSKIIHKHDKRNIQGTELHDWTKTRLQTQEYRERE